MIANKNKTVIYLMKNTTVLKLDSFSIGDACRHQQSAIANYYYHYSWSRCTAYTQNCMAVHAVRTVAFLWLTKCINIPVQSTFGCVCACRTESEECIWLIRRATDVHDSAAVALFATISWSSTSSMHCAQAHAFRVFTENHSMPAWALIYI